MAAVLPQPALSSARVHLREFRRDDAPALFAVHGDPRVMRYWSFPPWTELAQAQERVEMILAQRAANDAYVWAIAEAGSDRLIGSIAVFSIQPAQARAEIGYSLHADWQGRGLAQESLRLVLSWLLGEAGFVRIEADVDPRNAPSCRLLQRLGFVREGVLRQRWRVAGEVSDTALYGLLKPEFVAAPAPPAPRGAVDTSIA
jgi:RimJ/RimL family protein N-acetyltransferase